MAEWYVCCDNSNISVKAFPPNRIFPPVPSDCQLQQSPRALIMTAVVALMLTAVPLYSQSPTQPATAKPKPATASKIAVIKSLRIIQEKDGQAVEILSTKPLVPSIQAIVNPDRLVIDLPNARLDIPEKKISVQADQISFLRADQFQANVARVVVDLLEPRAFTWDAAGNRLVVHMGKSATEAKASQPAAPTVPTLSPTPQPTVSVVRAPGPLALASGDNSSAVSSITASADTVVLRLSTGGNVNVCPGTTISVTPSQNRHNLLLSMNTGAIEAHLGLDASSDTVMTPDFRILLVGPGQFHYAISADNQGNTCVRALPGNMASAIVSELMGDRTYQVKATDQLVFRAGQLDRVDMAVPLECGCPPPRDATMRATNNLPTQTVSGTRSSSVTSASASPAPPVAMPRSESAPIPGNASHDASVTPNELHVQVEAPFVFHATGPPPLPLEVVRALPLDSRPPTDLATAAALPPPDPGAKAASENHPPRSFFRKIGGFFASLFH
jgi:hypothetical protein